MYKLLLNLFIIINILITIFILFSGFKSSNLAEFDIYILIPILYILYILPINTPLVFQKYFAQLCIDNYEADHDKSVDQVIHENQKIYILPEIYNYLSSFYPKYNFNPFNYNGVLALGLIINVYLLRYKWKKI